MVEVKLERRPLTDGMLRFLEELPKHPSDKKRATAAELKPQTVATWKLQSKYAPFPDFQSAYDEVYSRWKTAVEDFDEATYMEEVLVPASLKRLGELVHTEIQSGMESHKVGHILRASEIVLKGTGRLTPDMGSGVSVNVVVADHLAEGVRYRAPWMAQLKSDEPPPPTLPALPVLESAD